MQPFAARQQGHSRQSTKAGALDALSRISPRTSHPRRSHLGSHAHTPTELPCHTLCNLRNPQAPTIPPYHHLAMIPPLDALLDALHRLTSFLPAGVQRRGALHCTSTRAAAALDAVRCAASYTPALEDNSHICAIVICT